MANIEELLNTYPPQVYERAMELRAFLFQELENIREMVDLPARVIGYGYGTGYKDSICTMILSKKGVKLGFYKGASLPDPAQILTGTGKVHKYVEVNSSADIKKPALKKLLEEALKAYKQRLSD